MKTGLVNWSKKIKSKTHFEAITTHPFCISAARSIKFGGLANLIRFLILLLGRGDLRKLNGIWITKNGRFNSFHALFKSYSLSNSASFNSTQFYGLSKSRGLLATGSGHLSRGSFCGIVRLRFELVLEQDSAETAARTSLVCSAVAFSWHLPTTRCEWAPG